MTAQQVKTGQSLPGRLVFVLLLGCTISIQSIYAHDFGGSSSGGGGDPPPPPGPPCNSCPCSGPGGGGGGGGSGNSNDNPSGSGGKPVSFYNGAEEMTLTDLVVSGIFPIVIQRKYDSRSSYDSPLGYGWAFLHDRRLYEYPDNSVIVRHGCGTRDRYVYSGGAYVTPTGSMLASLSEEPDGSFRLKYLNGITDTFDSQGRLITATDARGNRHEYTYDPLGKLPLVGSSKESISPTTPMTVAYTYRLTRIDVRGADGALTGRYVTFAYDEATGRLTSATTDDGRSIAYQHDLTQSLTLGNLTQVNGLEGIVSTYAYADPLDAHNLTSITPSQGRTPIINTYDDQDRVTRQEEGARRMDIVYNVPYTRTTVTRTIRDQNGLNPYTAATTYEFDTTGRVTKLIDALGHETRYTYNAAKLLTRKEVWQKSGTTLSLLQAMDWTYDVNGNKLTEGVTLDSGETITRFWTYQQNWIASEQVVSSVAPTKIFRTEYTFHYGTDGRPTNIQSAKRRRDNATFQTITYAYDSRNRLVSKTFPDGTQLISEYTGDYVTRTYVSISGAAASQLERQFDYDAEGHLTEEQDARGNVTTHDYDARGRLIRTTNALSEETHYTYSGERLTEIEVGRTASGGEGRITRLLYDSRDQLIGKQRKNDAGVFVDFQTLRLDSEGHLIGVVDGTSQVTLITYDAAGNIRSVTDAAGKTSQFSYDAAGNRTWIKDPLNREKILEYDDFGRLAAVVELGVTPNVRSTRTYDAVGNLLSWTDGGSGVTSYQYDALSRNTGITQQLGQSVQLVYDNRDRLDYVVNARGHKIDFTYAQWGPILEEKHFANVSATTALRTTSYSYDDDGNVTSVTDTALQATPAYSLTYDALGRVYDETAHYIPGGDRALSRRYDRYGNRSELTVIDGGTVTNTYAYNKLDQLQAASLGGSSLGLAYFGNDTRQQITYPGNVMRSLIYKPNGPLDSIAITGPAGQLAQLMYSYDDTQNIETYSDQYGSHELEYDGMDRLTQASHAGGAGLANESFGYDAAGNREDPLNASLYVYDGNNRLTAGPAGSYTFDADGSVQSVSDGSMFTHDARSRLTQFIRGTTSASYVYDAGGRRVRKIVNGVQTWFLWDGSNLLAEYDGAGNRTARYSYLNNEHTPSKVEDANGAYFVHTDHSDTPRYLTDSNGVVVWKARLQTFGQAVVETDVDGNGINVVLNLRYPGQYFDAESGLHYNLLRYYDPMVGRYIESDPIGLTGGSNVYLYAEANPLRRADPWGLIAICNNNFVIDRYTRTERDSKRWLLYQYDWFDWEITGLDGGLNGDAENLARGRGAKGPPVGPGFGLGIDWYWVTVYVYKEEIYEIYQEYIVWSQLCTEQVETCEGFETRTWTQRKTEKGRETYRRLVDTNYYTETHRHGGPTHNNVP